MSSGRITPISNFHPKASDTIIFDSNILIKLFYPLQTSNAVAYYSGLYAQVLTSKSNLLITSIQISEFINRCIRFQFGLYEKSHANGSRLDFKQDYRSTDDYRESMNAILDIVSSDIAPNFNFINDNFNDMKKDSLFKYGFSYDFNDAILLEVARLNNAILVTDDKDFANYSSKVRIITNNKKLLMFS